MDKNKIILNRKRLSEIQKGFSAKKTDIPNWKYEWNFLMLNYGWIPKTEFFEMNAQDIEDLIQILIEIKEKNKPKK